MEEWRRIPGLEFYEASSLGRIRSIDRGGIKGRVLAPQVTGRRYPVVSIAEHGRVRTMVVHRLVARAFIPNPDGLPEINHIDGDRLNAKPENMEWCTRAHNNAHAIATGLKPPVRGERHGQTRLTATQVIAIRMMRAYGVTCDDVAQRYGVSSSTVHRIEKRQTWGHVA